jgi:2-amino-4-hydroxy-6-hydroxymethyldihydropteridine diphosphokinase
MILLALGSNLKSSFGDRFYNLDLAISYLELYEIKVIKKSSYYQTDSFPNKNNPKFINMIVQVETSLDPVNLASVIIFIEEKLERKRNKKNDPRTCDIDIIDFKSKKIIFKYNNLDFEVPHKELNNRNFVLIPIQEIAPNWSHPVTNDSINSLIERLSIKDKNSILKVNKS